MRVRALALVASVALAVLYVWWPGGVSADSYVVKEGEALGTIAARVGMSTSRLASLNGIRNPDLIQAGQVLTTSEPAKYVVRRGDTLGGIAARHGMSESYLAALNSLDDPDYIYESQVLVTSGPAGVTRTVAVDILCPVDGTVAFENDYGYLRADGSRHEGVDLFAARGTPVVAPVSGRLVRDPNPSGGLAFQLYGDDGIRYYGAHLDRYGWQGLVGEGDVIGYVGNTGDARTTSPHLHLEMHPGSGLAMSPYPSLARAC